MKRCLFILFLLISISFLFPSFEKDMIYHNEPRYYWAGGSHLAFACYFKLSDFSISGYDYKINIIGFIGYDADGPADIYVTSKEEWDGNKYVPVCNPYNNWEGADYGPKSWHINNTYPKYDDCNVYDDNWNYSKHVDKFWCIYSVRSCPPPYPLYDGGGSSMVNSLTWAGDLWWHKGVPSNYNSNWCMHCVIVYWPDVIENTSIGVVKALFK